MEPDDPNQTPSSFLGTGWSFPPEFALESGEVLMTADEQDIEASLHVLFGTALGERFLNPKYGLAIRDILFEPLSTTMTTLLEERIETALLIYEPRIDLVQVEVDSSSPNDGSLRIFIEYEVRATNSRFNLVFPFYRKDSNEVRGTVTGAGGVGL